MKNLFLAKKNKRMNIIDLKKNHPEEFGRFVMALKNLEESDDWYRICGIHGNTFKPNDPEVLCPTDPKVVSFLAETGEPQYCKHKVYTFIAWHVPYVYQFELLLNKYNTSTNKEYITLPYMDLTNFSNDFSFLNDPKITITYDSKKIMIDNPFVNAYYYKDGVKTKITRNGYLTPTTKKERIQLNTVKKELNNALYASSYERFSSHPVSYTPSNIVSNYTPLETPHNTLHDVIGGDSGNMGEISISAFDPLFWLHHCNMDRHFYTWLYNNTNHFSKSIYPDKIDKDLFESTQAPFFDSGVYNWDPKNYKYGWQNKDPKYMLLKETINVKDFPYTYDIIKPKPFEPVNNFIELIDIPIPQESVLISVYIHRKNEQLNKELHFAGSNFWFGINRKDKFCQRCAITRTNFKIDIEEYLQIMAKDMPQLSKVNENDYNFVIEGNGRIIKNEMGYNVYSQEELIKDGSIKIVIN
jgi:hypothetical protein